MIQLLQQRATACNNPKGHTMNCTECKRQIHTRDGSWITGSVAPDSLTPDVCEDSPSGHHWPENGNMWPRSDRSAPGGPDWARDMFGTPTDDGREADSWHNVPIGLRRALCRFWSCYPMMPKGVCDPMYFANVLAMELGLGNGRSEFVTTSTEQQVSQ